MACGSTLLYYIMACGSTSLYYISLRSGMAYFSHCCTIFLWHGMWPQSPPLDPVLDVPLCRSGLCHRRCYRGDPGERLDGIDGFSPGELYRGIFRGTLLDQTLKAKDVCGLV